jgi:hypothetical protein
MNYTFSFMLLLNTFTSFYCSETQSNTTKNPILACILVNEDNAPTPALLAILNETKIEHDGTLQTIFTETQKKWLRPAGQERWEDQTPLTCDCEKLPQLFEKLSLTQEIKPAHLHYDYAVLLGATLNTVRNRLAHLIALWDSGIHFDSIIILGGKRPLDNTIESSQALLNNTVTSLPFKQNWEFNGQLPTTETEMMKFVFDQTDTPATWKTIPLIFVDAPMQKTENGSLRRPNTQDTVDEWLKNNPKPGSILSISNQPYIGYQDAVLRKALPKEFTVETAGEACSDDKKPTVILDSLARWIYNEHHIILQRNN